MTNPPRRSTERLIGVKVLIITASLVGTIGGWALLAANQVGETLNARPAAPQTQSAQIAPQAQPTQIAPNSPQQNQPATTLRQVPGTTRPNARTRSSR